MTRDSLGHARCVVLCLLVACKTKPTAVTIEGGVTSVASVASVVVDAGPPPKPKPLTGTNLATTASSEGMWCLDGPWIPNEKLIPPYKISSLNAYQRGRLTKHFREVEAGEPGVFVDFGQISCPTKCDPVARHWGYGMRIESHSNNDLDLHSTLIEWVYIDAVTGVMSWDDGAQSEPLPPN